MAPEVANLPSDGDGIGNGNGNGEPALTSVVAHRGRSKDSYAKLQLESYVNRELLQTATLLEQQDKVHQDYKTRHLEIAEYQQVRHEYRSVFTPSRLYGQGYKGYGNGFTDMATKVQYAHQKPRAGQRKTRKLHIKRKDMQLQAEDHEELVPIRIEVDWDKIKLRDTFTWNVHDRTVDMKLYAEQLVEDFGLQLPMANPVLESILQQMQEQVNDFYPHVYMPEEALDPELPYSAYKNDEMRITINLNITIGTATLEDNFEWDINDPLNSPEEFAECLAKDLSLGGEFITSIAHCIREQSQLFTKSLYVIGHPFDGRPIDDADLNAVMLPSPLPSTFRPQNSAKNFGPAVYEMTEQDIERSEKMYSREQRRQKRSVNRRGGPTLPDLKDRQRTVRTRIISSTVPNAATREEPNPIFKRVGGKKKNAGLREDGSDSSDDLLEDSGPDSPVVSTVPSGTARTRGMRGAATQAQQRMANLGRSETPEAIAHHHETRTSARRFGGPVREDSPAEPISLIVKLKINKSRLRKWSEDIKRGVRPPAPQPTSSFTRPATVAPVGTPTPGSMGPPSTPGAQSQPLPTAVTPAVAAGQVGRIDAPPPPGAGQPANVPVSIYNHSSVSIYEESSSEENNDDSDDEDYIS